MNRTTKSLLLGVAFLLGLAALAAIGRAGASAQEPEIPDNIKAHRFTLVDSRGAARAILGGDEKGVRLVLCDREGKDRATLNVAVGGRCELWLYNAKGRQACGLWVGPDGQGHATVVARQSGMPLWQMPEKP